MFSFVIEREQRLHLQSGDESTRDCDSVRIDRKSIESMGPENLSKTDEIERTYRQREGFGTEQGWNSGQCTYELRWKDLRSHVKKQQQIVIL